MLRNSFTSISPNRLRAFLNMGKTPLRKNRAMPYPPKRVVTAKLNTVENLNKATTATGMAQPRVLDVEAVRKKMLGRGLK